MSLAFRVVQAAPRHAYGACVGVRGVVAYVWRDTVAAHPVLALLHGLVKAKLLLLLVDKLSSRARTGTGELQ